MVIIWSVAIPHHFFTEIKLLVQINLKI